TRRRSPEARRSSPSHAARRSSRMRMPWPRRARARTSSCAEPRRASCSRLRRPTPPSAGPHLSLRLACVRACLDRFTGREGRLGRRSRRGAAIVNLIKGYDPETLREIVDERECETRLAELENQRSLPVLLERVWLLKVLD